MESKAVNSAISEFTSVTRNAWDHDLNAMHEAECALPERVRNFEYLQCLGIMCEPGRHPIHASAAQRAEALLRTIGKWVEPKP